MVDELTVTYTEAGLRAEDGSRVDVVLTIVGGRSMDVTRFEVDGRTYENWVFPLRGNYERRFHRDNDFLLREAAIWIGGGPVPTPLYESANYGATGR